ncbi:MAG TPA: hypothetical protein VD866_20360 [Urbifossiella sp.]|nr:hypothetical protein [Urbifossiella sp.]
MDLARLLGAALGLLVPAAVLFVVTPDERSAVGMTAAPFVYPRLLAAHLAAAVPLGLVLAARVPPRDPAARARWVAAGVAAAVGVALIGPGLGDELAAGKVGAAPLLVLRTLLAAALVVPWCVAAAAGTGTVEKPGQWEFAAAGLLALLPPGMYAETLARARTASAEELLATGRPAKALPHLTGAVELGGDRKVEGKAPAEARRSADALVAQLRKGTAAGLPPTAPPAVQLRFAVALIQLDELDAAADRLRPLAATDDTAQLLLATVYRDQEKWADSDAAYEAALARLLPRAGADPAARRGCATAFEGLAHNARGAGRPAAAGAVYRRALAELPAEAARFHFLLGRHEHDGGRPAAALEHLRAAAELDPAGYAKSVGDFVAAIRSHTYGCVLR